MAIRQLRLCPPKRATSDVLNSRRMKRGLRPRTRDNTKISTLNVNPAQAYFEGILSAALGVRIFGDNVVEWQIDAVKEYAKKMKDEEIEHAEIALAEKANQKRLWKRWIDETAKGFKEVLRREGRME